MVSELRLRSNLGRGSIARKRKLRAVSYNDQLSQRWWMVRVSRNRYSIAGKKIRLSYRGHCWQFYLTA